MFETNKNYNESNIETISRIPDEFVDLVVTSPPYDDLRDYKGYEFEFEKLVKGLFRTLKPGGVVVWVVNDASINGGKSGTSLRQCLKFQDEGFLIHDYMIYQKNGASYPANEKSTRYSQVFEFMFVFSKGKPKTVNLIKDKKNRWGGHTSFGKVSSRMVDGQLKQGEKVKIAEFGYRENIWKYNTGKGYTTKDEFAFDHPAMFPEKLAFDHIKTWTDENDVVYDPFMGSGTTAKCAISLNRKWIGSEISKEYSGIIEKRIYDLNNNLFT